MLLPLLAASWLPLAGPAPAPRVHTVDVGAASVTVALEVGVVERPVLVPVRLQARLRPHVSPGLDVAPVVVQVCDDWRCNLRTEHTLPIDGAPFVLEVPMWPAGVTLRFLHGEDERTCCGVPARALHVVATTEAGDGGVVVELDVQREDLHEGGVQVYAAGDALRARPALLEAFSGVIVGDDDLEAGRVDARFVSALRAWAAAGGALSVPASLATTLGVDGAPAPMELAWDARTLVSNTGPLQVALPRGTRAAQVGDGVIVLRPPGASWEQRVAGLLAARPDLSQYSPVTQAADLVPVRAAAAGLAVRPHRGVAFAIALAVVIGTALALRSARRRGWRWGLAACALLGGAGLAASWLLEIATIPGEVRARVVAWVGPGAAWEVGVDAARPRTERELEVSSPVPPVATLVLGEQTLPARAPRVDVTEDGATRVRAAVGSASALAVAWQRRAPVVAGGLLGTAGAPVALVGDELVNRTPYTLRAVTLHRGARVARDVPAHGSVSQATFVPFDTWRDDEALADLSTTERRLLHEITEGCASRQQRRGVGRFEECGAAVALLDDGTVLGIEVTP